MHLHAFLLNLPPPPSHEEKLTEQTAHSKHKVADVVYL
jgi:hypothetical protein